MPDLTAQEVYRSLRASKLAHLVTSSIVLSDLGSVFIGNFQGPYGCGTVMREDYVLAILRDVMWRKLAEEKRLDSVWSEDGEWWCDPDDILEYHRKGTSHGTDCAAALMHRLTVEVVRV